MELAIQASESIFRLRFPKRYLKINPEAAGEPVGGSGVSGGAAAALVG
jgi:hypothetical protein